MRALVIRVKDAMLCDVWHGNNLNGLMGYSMLYFCLLRHRPTSAVSHLTNSWKQMRLLSIIMSSPLFNKDNFLLDWLKGSVNVHMIAKFTLPLLPEQHGWHLDRLLKGWWHFFINDIKKKKTNWQPCHLMLWNDKAAVAWHMLVKIIRWRMTFWIVTSIIVLVLSFLIGANGCDYSQMTNYLLSTYRISGTAPSQKCARWMRVIWNREDKNGTSTHYLGKA